MTLRGNLAGAKNNVSSPFVFQAMRIPNLSSAADKNIVFTKKVVHIEHEVQIKSISELITKMLNSFGPDLS